VKKKLFLSGILAVALMGSAMGTNHSAHASTLKPHQTTTPFIRIDSTVHLNGSTTGVGDAVMVGVHYSCLSASLPTGTITVTVSQDTGVSGDGSAASGAGAETVVCDGESREVGVYVPSSTVGTDFNIGPATISATLIPATLPTNGTPLNELGYPATISEH
jgi:hypothetical protein